MIYGGRSEICFRVYTDTSTLPHVHLYVDGMELCKHVEKRRRRRPSVISGGRSKKIRFGKVHSTRTPWNDPSILSAIKFVYGWRNPFGNESKWGHFLKFASGRPSWSPRHGKAAPLCQRFGTAARELPRHYPERQELIIGRLWPIVKHLDFGGFEERTTAFLGFRSFSVDPASGRDTSFVCPGKLIKILWVPVVIESRARVSTVCVCVSTSVRFSRDEAKEKTSNVTQAIAEGICADNN